MALTGKHEKAIEALLKHPKLVDAAKASKLSLPTLHRYLKDPEFKEALREAQENCINAVITRLAGMGSEAIKTLATEMDDKEAKSSDRSTAAKITLDFLFKGHDISITQRKLEDIEQKLKVIEGGQPSDDRAPTNEA